MSHQKDKHYWTQLRGALTAGRWIDPNPAQTPYGSALSWSELLRKFNKHCKGFRDVAEVASQTQALALLLGANSANEDDDNPPGSGTYPLGLGGECMLPEERKDDAREGYKILKGLQSANSDSVQFALAYYAYALGNPSECLSHLASIPDLLLLHDHIPVQADLTRSSTPRLQHFGSSLSSSTVGGSLASFSDSAPPEVRDGRGWAATETVRSLCLQGMSHEKLSPSEPVRALKCYSAVLPLLTLIVSDVAPNSAPTTPGKSDFASFTQYRELWRWVERLLWRAIVLSARTSDLRDDGIGDNCSIWAWLSQYSTCSAYWPSYFRTAHRSTISVLYLEAHILRYPGTPTMPVLHNDSTKPPPWLSRVRSIINDYRGVLNVSTTFPRAGERNIKVEDFVDLCVGIWEAAGSVGDYAGWVLDVLWWATRLTFNSHRIYRHMTRLLYASGDIALAKRTLGVYVQVVGNAWQANNETPSDWTDDNRSWVGTLVWGARMLCKSASATYGREGIADAREAGKCLEKARTRLNLDDECLVASVDLAEGIWNSVMALKEQHPRTRSKRLTDAHAALLRSVQGHATPSGYFHLALSFARPGPSQDLAEAIEYAGLAVEGDSTETRYWHLLGLLLAASERWKAASEILERGAELGEVGGGSDEGNENDTPGGQDTTVRGESGSDATSIPVAAPSASESDGSTCNPDAGSDQPTQGPLSLLAPGASYMIGPSTLLKHLPDHPLPSKQEVFEYALQLRMTQVALKEVMDGAEGAELKWVDVFSWIAEARGTATEQTPRASGDFSRRSVEKARSFVSHPLSEKVSNETPAPAPVHPDRQEKTDTLSPIPITISPATPEVESMPIPPVPEKMTNGGLQPKRSSSVDRQRSRSKKMQRMLKNRVHKGQVTITTISKKIGHGVVRNNSLRRTISSPDFHAVFRQTHYQASSIHSRRRISSITTADDRTPTESPPPPPPPATPPQEVKVNNRLSRLNRLLADAWLMSAATFRRLGKIEQARGAIQEAEVRDESNPAVWVQLGLYHYALGLRQQAVEALKKALFISQDDVSASVHLARLYLSDEETRNSANESTCSINVDLAAGLLSHLTQGPGWDVPEAWYFLAKAYGLQGRKDRERECLKRALELSEKRGIREIASAIGWCI